jgi:valyl-tRNA synthetase
MLSAYPKEKGDLYFDDKAMILISEIRNIRNSKSISPKETIEVVLNAENESHYEPFSYVIMKLGRLSSLKFGKEVPENCHTVLVKTDEAYVILQQKLDVGEEKKRIESELKYLEGFLKSVSAKLNNEKFVANAKAEVVQNERQKESDAVEKIRSLKDTLKNL